MHPNYITQRQDAEKMDWLKSQMPSGVMTQSTPAYPSLVADPSPQSEISQQMGRLHEACSLLENATAELWRRLESVTRGPVDATEAVGNKALPPIDSQHGRELHGAGERIFSITGSLSTLIAALRV